MKQTDPTPPEPSHPPERSERIDPPDIGTLSGEELNELFRRRALLGELADQEHVSNSSRHRVGDNPDGPYRRPRSCECRHWYPELFDKQPIRGGSS